MKRYIILLMLYLAAMQIQAQEHHHHHAVTPDTVKHGGHQMPANNGKQGKPKSKPQSIPVADTTAHSMHHQEDHTAMQAMSSAFSLSLPMNRNGSGTGWQPDEAPVYGYMQHAKKWMLMYHGTMFLRYNAQNVNNKGKRGSASQFDSPNWIMVMAQRQVGKNGLLSLSGMLSLDVLTMGGNGYPLLFQSGETWNDEPLVNRQHPHDVFMGLTIGYTQRINSDIDVYGHFGFPGEPALGPTTFMHRISAINAPDAPLGHHWQDASHITFGVGTIGFRYKIAKIEGSIFTGREPNEFRYDFDKPRFDSYSYRLSVNPHKTLALQFSQGFIKSPEALEPGENIMRTTASLQHAKRLGEKSFVASTVVYGLNTKHHDNLHTVLLETNYLHQKNFDVYGRYEFVQKNTHELVLPDFGDDIFNIHALTVGADYIFFSMANVDARIGAQVSGYVHPRKLNTVYGKMPVSYQIFLKINPSMMRMS